jgi:adenine-specific DNA-methyltransferase
MAIKYIPYFPNTLEGQAVLDNFVRTKRLLRYRDNDRVIERIERGLPLYEAQLRERRKNNADGNLIIRGECLSACAYLKDKGITVDLVYIDPPFASGADYAKKVYLRRNPKVAEAIRQAESELDIEELRSFEEKMYGDIWNKESYLNWMYENLMAIKSILSENGTIYVHLDYNISHYVKIVMDEVFGENSFLNNIVWCYQTRQFSKLYFNRKHHDIFWYAKNPEKYTFNWNVEGVLQNYSEATIKKYKYKDENGYYRLCGRGIEGSPIKGAKDVDPKWEIEHPELVVRDYLGDGFAPSDYWMIDIVNQASNERVDYATQKPEALLERIIKASSNEGMVVADFFGGSGVTAAVTNRLGRKFIHADININSIQTTRDRLVAADAEFDVLEIKDGVSLYRNPVQTMERLKKLIPGLRNEDALDKFWEGSIVDTKYGMTPVYLPNLMDGGTRVLDKPLMNRIIREAMPDLPDGTKRVIVYYIDIDNREEIEQFIKEEGNPLIEIELRDLKQILDDMVVEDAAEWTLSEVSDNLFNGWKVEITHFQSDRVLRKIDELNQKNQLQVLQQNAKGKNKTYVPIHVSDEGLETIEWISLDCSTAEKTAPWHSDSEIKIDKQGYVIRNGVKTAEYWDGCIRCDNKPLRMMIRNICGDETMFVL